MNQIPVQSFHILQFCPSIQASDWRWSEHVHSSLNPLTFYEIEGAHSHWQPARGQDHRGLQVQPEAPSATSRPGCSVRLQVWFKPRTISATHCPLKYKSLCLIELQLTNHQTISFYNVKHFVFSSKKGTFWILLILLQSGADWSFSVMEFFFWTFW